MKLFTVKCSAAREPEEEEHRLGFVVAETAQEAEQLCRNALGGEGFVFFQTAEEVGMSHWDGPATVLRWEGDNWPEK
jgi:hypothetical protein